MSTAQLSTRETATHPSDRALPARLWAALSVQGTLGLSLLILVTVGSVLAPVLSPHDPLAQDLANRLHSPTWRWLSLGDHPLGTDPLGRDVLSRILYGGRISVMIAAVAVVIGTVVGGTLGLLAGYIGGSTDRVIMRLTDIQLSLPPIILALALIAVHGASLPALILVLALSAWPPVARVFRGEALSHRDREYVLATRTIGARPGYVLLHHVLPNTAGPGIVIATLELGRTVLLAAALSFLGLGVQPPTPDWGAMLSGGRDYLTTAWWICTFPGIALIVLVTGVNLMGDWLRDRLDPHVENE